MNKHKNIDLILGWENQSPITFIRGLLVTGLGIRNSPQTGKLYIQGSYKSAVGIWGLPSDTIPVPQLCASLAFHAA